MNAESLAAHAQQRLQIGFHETTADGRFSLEPVYCLGNCACSPAIMIDDELHGRVSAERFDALHRSTRARDMNAVVYVPRDAAALSVGAEQVAQSIVREATARGIDLTLKRNGSRGMCWLEPLVEVVVGGERYAYGPVDRARRARTVRGRFSAATVLIRSSSVPPNAFLTSAVSSV